jgi:hypothetical protein
MAYGISSFFPQFHQSLVPAAVVAVELVTKGDFFNSPGDNLLREEVLTRCRKKEYLFHYA